MFEKLKAMFGAKPAEAPAPADSKPAGMAPLTAASFTPTPRPAAARKPTRADISRASQQVHDELGQWAQLWFEKRYNEVPEKYRATFNQYLKHFAADDTVTADQYYEAIAKERCIEILESWGFPDPAKQ